MVSLFVVIDIVLVMVYNLRVIVAVVVPSSIFGHALLKLFTNFIATF